MPGSHIPDDLMIRMIRLIALSSFLLSLGIHLPVLQTWAWARMTIQFSRTESLQRSLQKTLNGQNPCGMCLKVKRAASSTDSLRAAIPSPSRDALVPQPSLLLYTAISDLIPEATNLLWTSCAPPLDTPPPNLHLA